MSATIKNYEELERLIAQKETILCSFENLCIPFEEKSNPQSEYWNTLNQLIHIAKEQEPVLKELKTLYDNLPQHTELKSLNKKISNLSNKNKHSIFSKILEKRIVTYQSQKEKIEALINDKLSEIEKIKKQVDAPHNFQIEYFNNRVCELKPQLDIIKQKLTVELGNYLYDSNLVQPIKWEIVEIKNNYALIVCCQAIEYKEYQNPNKGFSLTRWLNKEFYENSFSESEKNMVCHDRNVLSMLNPNNTKTKDICGPIFIPGKISKYQDALCCEPTPYARNISSIPNEQKYCSWWTSIDCRPIHKNFWDPNLAREYYNKVANSKITIDENGREIGLFNEEKAFVRPAMWITL